MICTCLICQKELTDRHSSVHFPFLCFQDSPDIPYSAERRPKTGLLKNKNDISIVATPSPSSSMVVKKNTQINGKSKTARILNRMSASDFF